MGEEEAAAAEVGLAAEGEAVVMKVDMAAEMVDMAAAAVEIHTKSFLCQLIQVVAVDIVEAAVDTAEAEEVDGTPEAQEEEAAADGMPEAQEEEADGMQEVLEAADITTNFVMLKNG